MIKEIVYLVSGIAIGIAGSTLSTKIRESPRWQEANYRKDLILKIVYSVDANKDKKDSFAEINDFVSHSGIDPNFDIDPYHIYLAIYDCKTSDLEKIALNCGIPIREMTGSYNGK